MKLQGTRGITTATCAAAFIVGASVVQAATFTVSTTADSGAGSLRQAISDANAAAGADLIAFAIPAAGVQTIVLSTPLPTITDAVTIDGYTQAGATPNTQAVGDNAILLIEININGNAEGLIIGANGGGSTVRGVVLNRESGNAIHIQSGNNVIEGNFIGVDATGTTEFTSAGTGVFVDTGAGNRVGGTTPQSRNVVAGNNYYTGFLNANIEVGGTGVPPSNTVVTGNYIGINAPGKAAIHNFNNRGAPGVEVSAGTNTVIRGNVISGNPSGIQAQSNTAGVISGLTIQGNLIGLTADGTAAVANADGVFMTGTGPDNVVIGGPNAGEGNVISGNADEGLILGLIKATIQGNYVGTDLTGTKPVPNSPGAADRAGLHIGIGGSGDNPAINYLVGGTVPGAGNVISGNSIGLLITGIGGGLVLVEGNFIGTQNDGHAPLPNNGPGISMNRPAIIGGTNQGEGNVVAYNRSNGITLSTQNANITCPILGNSIYGNTGLGISLAGFVLNDLGDADTGANDQQNFPVITTASNDGTNTTVVGTFNSKANLTYRLEFYSNTVLGPTGYGQGENFLGATTVTTDGSGNASFNVSFPQLSDGLWVSSTATDPNGNTSEFAASVQITGPVTVNASTVTGRTGRRFRFPVVMNGGTTAYRLTASGLPPGLTADPVSGVISGTPTADGSYQVALTLSDGTSTIKADLQLVFTSDPTVPVITSPYITTLQKGTAFSYKIQVDTSSPPSSDPITYTLVGALPPNLTFNASTGTISGTLAVRAEERASVVKALSGGSLLGNVQIFAANSHGVGTSPITLLTAPGPVPLNISTRLPIGTGENVLIAGFIVTGNAPKAVLLRGIGPTLPVGTALQDPYLELHDGTGAVLGANDNWRTDQQQDVQDTTIPPSDDREAAIVAAIAPGNYTAIVKGSGDTTGVGLAEAYDLGTISVDTSGSSQLAQISTRGIVGTDNDVMIGGFIIGGGTAKVIVRGIGPSLKAAGVANALVDPMVEIHDGSGNTIASNDDWENDANAAKVQALGIAPSDPKESALYETLSPGAYTAVLRGQNNGTGVGLVEIYNLP